MEEIGINPPAVIRLKKMLNEKGFNIPDEIIEMDELAAYVKEQVTCHE